MPTRFKKKYFVVVHFNEMSKQEIKIYRRGKRNVCVRG